MPIDPEKIDLMKRFVEQCEGTARRSYPNGRISADDDGQLAVAMTADLKRKRIIIRFGKATTWLGLSAADARVMIGHLTEKLKLIES